MLTASCSEGNQETTKGVPVMSINDRMTTVVTPATETLWGIEDPQSDTEWQLIDDASVEVAEAYAAMQQGGSGKQDRLWAANADWDAMMNEVIGAAEMVRKAIADRNIDGVVDAGGVMYPPCENCHLKYHPGAAGQVSGA